MALSVSIPKEITAYKSKLIGGLSPRKLICLLAAVLLGVGTFFLCSRVLGISTTDTGTIVMVIAAPLLAVGFIEKDSLPLEKYAVLYLRHRFGTQRLPYSAEIIINAAPMDKHTQKERNETYAWIFQKKAKQQSETAAGRGSSLYRSTRKERQRKCASARAGIEAARKEFLAAKKAQRQGKGNSA